MMEVMHSADVKETALFVYYLDIPGITMVCCQARNEPVAGFGIIQEEAPFEHPREIEV